MAMSAATLESRTQRHGFLVVIDTSLQARIQALRVDEAESSNRTRHGRPWPNRAMRLAQLMNSLRGRTRARRGMPAARTAPGGGRRWAAGPRGARGCWAAGLDASRS